MSSWWHRPVIDPWAACALGGVRVPHAVRWPKRGKARLTLGVGPGWTEVAAEKAAAGLIRYRMFARLPAKRKVANRSGTQTVPKRLGDHRSAAIPVHTSASLPDRTARAMVAQSYAQRAGGGRKVKTAAG